MRLPAPAAGPPIILFADVDFSIRTPDCAPPVDVVTAAVPVAFVPMKFPWMVLPLPSIEIPSNEFAAMTFRAAAVVPPMRLFDEVPRDIPRKFRRAVAPFAATPR